MRPIKEKQVEDMTSFPKRKEGIINIIAITNIVHVKCLSVALTFQCVTLLYQKLSSSVMLCGCVHIYLFPIL